MIVYDPIYGRFEVPRYLRPLVTTPEVRRLGQVRFLNTLTPSLATLGELRRYAHTLGVLHLSTRRRHRAFSDADHRALATSVLLHDIGTPPFGHLFEYHLRERFGWSHERVISAVLRGTHAPENHAHQIYAGRTIEFATKMRRAKIDTDIVAAIVEGRHPLSSLLFGTIDYDNLDNVVRMAWSLGIRGGADLAPELASKLTVESNGNLCLPASAHSSVVRWLQLRRAVYEVLVFDAPTVAAQAVLSEAIRTAFDANCLCEDDWYLSDEGLLERLRQLPETRRAVNREFLGRLPDQVFTLQLAGSLLDYGLADRAAAEKRIVDVVAAIAPRAKCVPYVFVDNGTFSKQLEFVDPISGDKWASGERSHSVVLYAFSRQRKLPQKLCIAAVESLKSDLGVDTAHVVRIHDDEREEALDAQRAFDFSS